MPDWEAEGLLEGLEGDARAQRLELLDHLHAHGFDLEELRRGADGLLAFLPAERVVMGGPAELTGVEVAERAGVPIETLSALRRAQGLPPLERDVRCYSEHEAEMAGTAAAFTSLGLSEDQMLAVTRVLGRGFAQAAQVMRATALEMVLTPGTTEKELAERYAAAVEAVMPYVGPMLDSLLRQHLRNMVLTEAIDAHELARGSMPGARDVAVAFADLVGFTRMGEELPAERVGAVADRLAVLAGDVVEAPVRMVKTIGDAAMLVSDDSAALVQAGLEVVAAVDREGADFPQVRVGITRGEALQRGGDWFGSPVNVASRITQIARAGSVLVAEPARVDHDALQWSFAGERRLRGVPQTVKLFRARPVGDGSYSSSSSAT